MNTDSVDKIISCKFGFFFQVGMRGLIGCRRSCGAKHPQSQAVKDVEKDLRGLMRMRK